MMATDLVLGVVSALWMLAVGLLSYRAGLHRGLALADGAESSTLGGWDWEGADQGEEGDD